MELTQLLRDFAVKTLGVAANADDDTIKSALSQALKDGKLKAKDYATMSEQAAQDDPRKELADIVTKAVVAGMKAMHGDNGGGTAVADPPEPEPTDEIERKINVIVEKRMAKLEKAHGSTPDFASRIMGTAALSMPRVKKAVEGYSHTKTAA